MGEEAPKAQQQLRAYEFRRTLEELEAVKGRGTELISVYVPPGRPVSDIMARLRNEYAESTNIKSRVTRSHVLWAIESAMNRLRQYREVPENGLVIFTGMRSAGSDKYDAVSHVIEPPARITLDTYRCDSTFFLDPLRDLLVERDLYGVLVMDRKEATAALIQGRRVEVLWGPEDSGVQSKHGRGGQSQRRFERIIEDQAHQWFVKVAEKMAELFLNRPITALLVGGPGPSKEYFVSEGYLHHELAKKVYKQLFDAGYTDEQGIKEMLEKAESELSDLALVRERRVMRQFMKEVAKTGAGLATYGESHVRRALEMGAVDTLLISESARKVRVVWKCPSCGHEAAATVAAGREADPAPCPKCGTAMEAQAKTDLIRELTEGAARYGTQVALISGESDEGTVLMTAFGGLGAILRFAVG
ncbi:MAG TPA: peptide chain release factor aRF-1 [Candidatus Thermoplasmatota archaeon]